MQDGFRQEQKSKEEGINMDSDKSAEGALKGGFQLKQESGNAILHTTMASSSHAALTGIFVDASVFSWQLC